MPYFIISNSEGDTHVDMVTKEELERRLDPEDPYYGDTSFIKGVQDLGDTNYWGNSILIIKGDMCVPKPVQVVTKFEV